MRFRLLGSGVLIKCLRVVGRVGEFSFDEVSAGQFGSGLFSELFAGLTDFFALECRVLWPNGSFYLLHVSKLL